MEILLLGTYYLKTLPREKAFNSSSACQIGSFSLMMTTDWQHAHGSQRDVAASDSSPEVDLLPLQSLRDPPVRPGNNPTILVWLSDVSPGWIREILTQSSK